MKERSIHAGNVATKILQRVISVNTNKRYMKERSTYAENVTTRLLQRVILPGTSKGYMKERSTHAGNVTTRLLQRAVSLNTSKGYMKEKSTHADHTLYSSTMVRMGIDPGGAEMHVSRLVRPEHLSVVFYSGFSQLYAAGQRLHVQQIFGHFEWNCAAGKFNVFQILNYF